MESEPDPASDTDSISNKFLVFLKRIVLKKLKDIVMFSLVHVLYVSKVTTFFVKLFSASKKTDVMTWKVSY